MKILEIRLGRYPPALFLQKDKPVIDALKGMAEKWVRHCPLVDEKGKLVGMVSIRDIIDFLGGGNKFDHLKKDYPSLYDALNRTALSNISYKPPFIETTTEFKDVIETMIEKGVGALAVVDENMNLVGIISERHIMSLFADTQTFVKVKEIMSSPIISLTPSDTLIEAQKVMTKHRIRRLPLISGNYLKGIITVKDIVKFYATDETLKKLANNNIEEIYNTPLSYISNKPVYTVDPDEDVGSAISIMRKHNIGSLVVVEDNKPVGIFTERDVVKKLAKIRGVEIFVDEAQKKIVAGRVAF